jgi:SAM-dependent methyltransferase
MDVRAYNRRAWNSQVEQGNMWTIPVSPQVIAAARRGEFSILLTATKPVPRSWFPELAGIDVLCLASGGGQQGPVLAAAGAQVTVFDNSPRQLEQDRLVAQREGLDIATIEGDMADLSAFPDECFDLIFHPVSNVFSAQVRPVWRECQRVLRPGGVLLAGIVNPVIYIFDFDLMDRENRMEVRYPLPYSDLESLSPEQRAQYEADGSPLEFSHTLEDQIGGQMQAGLVLVDLFEDWEIGGEVINQYFPKFIATRAVKLNR